MECPRCYNRLSFQQMRVETFNCAHCGARLKSPTERLGLLTFALGWLPWILLEAFFFRFENLILSVVIFVLSHVLVFVTLYATIQPTVIDPPQQDNLGR